MKVAAVIGATGYVGSHIVQCLLGKGYLVRCSTRNPSASGWLQDLSKNVELHKLELGTSGPEDSDSFNELLKGADSVFFCAGFETQAPETITFMRENALATIRCAAKNKVPCVVLTSSGGSTNAPNRL